MKSAKWFKKEVLKLSLILIQKKEGGLGFISNGYVLERLGMIYKEVGVNLHPILQKIADEQFRRDTNGV